MKKKIDLSLIVLLLILLGACSSANPGAASDNQVVDAAHTTENSIDWAGVYTGVIPAADGPGINVQLELGYDQTYTITYHYIDGEDSDFTVSGTFTWDPEGNIITLADLEETPPYYQVGENTITQLDMEGNPITGILAENYVLKKVFSE
ncbi:MAG: copper resistance protein NlpE [Treponema sp.]|jgi:uncharacterized lipoprotein NlpE involved in copper resistance|nr:copper resistance protein NlpE [Treponema sp.]